MIFYPGEGKLGLDPSPLTAVLLLLIGDHKGKLGHPDQLE
jgi:hypothetical protein